MSARPLDGAALPHEAHLAALASLEGVGPARLRRLLREGPPAEVWRMLTAGGAPSAARLGVEPEVLAGWRQQAASIDPAALWRRCGELAVGVVSVGSPGYPPALGDDVDPPVVLFHRGDPETLGSRRVTIIGTRRATGYGLRTAERLGRELAEAGVSVISGLALGVDAAAHRGAVSVPEGAPAVAVVGAGLHDPCPSRNRRLAEQVVERGAILSEVPPGVRSAPWRFPVRNRILAALGQVVVVVESAASGGSMHTVREALARDRPVLAVPGPIDSRSSEGTNLLLSEGAHPCLSVQDVMVALGGTAPTPPAGPSSTRRAEAVAAELRDDPTPAGERVLECLGWRPATVEQLALRSGLDFRELSVALGGLETAGWISRSGGWIERVASR